MCRSKRLHWRLDGTRILVPTGPSPHRRPTVWVVEVCGGESAVWWGIDFFCGLEWSPCFIMSFIAERFIGSVQMSQDAYHAGLSRFLFSVAFLSKLICSSANWWIWRKRYVDAIARHFGICGCWSQGIANWWNGWPGQQPRFRGGSQVLESHHGVLWIKLGIL